MEDQDSNPAKEVARDVFPFLRVYKDGTIQRLVATESLPPGLDSETNVVSKDVVIFPETGVSARLYLPNEPISRKKLPLVVYYHGGGFFAASTASREYHSALNRIVAASNVILASVDYRLAPENPIPVPYDDAFAALEWIAGAGGGSEPWLRDHADLDRVYLAGDSCGANMSHHFALKLSGSGRALRIRGVAMIHPYFWGKDPIGAWLFVCPSEKGCDDPLINPFVEEGNGSGLQKLGCERVIVVVAGDDILKDRGRLYYEKLVGSGWKGKAEYLETEGKDHVFHIIQPDCEEAKTVFKRLGAFFNDEP
ncbi:unnamed protein product [Linum tenue]|uniref:Alpha/beta hydrolase fold-3 domain-containing protein n=1 Tax=Linum tenue TaxID=586396 RepID=A0AAV0RLS1_9ROSI|nr:unnamed protein product [Linum tenue]